MSGKPGSDKNTAFITIFVSDTFEVVAQGQLCILFDVMSDIISI